MPAILDAPCHCGYAGHFGFVAHVGVITHYHHVGEPRCKGFYEYLHVRYATLADAWAVARRQYRDTTWRQAWDARIAGKPRVAKRLFRQWTEQVNNH